MKPWRLAHLSDVHLPLVARPRMRDASIKRMLGFINWHRRRKRVHRLETINLLISDLRAQAVDHIAVTGDLVNIGLPKEFVNADAWLRDVGDPDFVSFVPGNHDAYVRYRRDPGISRLHDYMCSDGEGVKYAPLPDAPLTRSSGGVPNSFPYVRIRDRVALVGLTSAIPTAPLVAAGSLGTEQREKLREILSGLGAQGLFRIVLIHHPPLPGLAQPIRALRDAEALKDVLSDAGAELVLYGHNHRQRRDAIETRDGPADVIGVPSASVTPPSHEPAARYNIFEVTRADGRWRLRMGGRSFSPDSGMFETDEDIVLRD